MNRQRHGESTCQATGLSQAVVRLEMITAMNAHSKQDEFALRDQIRLARFVNQLRDLAHRRVHRQILQLRERQQPEQQAQGADDESAQSAGVRPLMPPEADGGQIRQPRAHASPPSLRNRAGRLRGVSAVPAPHPLDAAPRANAVCTARDQASGECSPQGRSERSRFIPPSRKKLGIICVPWAEAPCHRSERCDCRLRP